MRFGVPRSNSPSPVRQRRRSSTFGVPSDSDSDDYTDNEYTSSNQHSDSSSHSESDSDSDSDSSSASSSSDSFCYASESEVPLPPQKSVRSLRTPAEQRRIDDTVAAIRLVTRHRDPYEEWERKTRKDAFRTARKVQHTIQSRFHDEQEKMHLRETQRLAALHARKTAEMEAQMAALMIKQKSEEAKLKEEWKERDRKLWERINAVIKFEEDKVKAKLELERRAREEEERKRREEAEKKRAEEEARKRIEEEKRMREEESKRKAAERERTRKLEEEEARKRKEEEERQKLEKSQADAQGRKTLGLMTAQDDWTRARKTLQHLKAGPMKTVKSQKELKSNWSALRRQITPKIGQLTNDPQAIARISQQLHDVLVPPTSSPHPPPIYHALLSSLAKAILLQAETEVTAEKRSAGPLAQVTANLLGRLNQFPDVFYAKLVQRAGGWPVPVVLPSTDVDGTPWGDDEAKAKALGYRKNGDGGMETTTDYISRMAGMMRVYFSILKVPVEQPLDRMFQMPRLWTWFARIMCQRGLLETAVAPQIIYAALDVFGLEAKSVWGNQWVKLLSLLYEGVTVGLDGGAIIGGQSAEGKAARTRVQLEIERIMGTG